MYDVMTVLCHSFQVRLGWSCDFNSCTFTAHYRSSFSNGNPNFSSKARAWALLLAWMTNITCKPCTVVVSSKLNSGKTDWSVKPMAKLPCPSKDLGLRSEEHTSELQSLRH